ncbi:UNVERIFIED_CONTAM: Kinase non-catalytic C-lobe domain-containing protein 1 [Gekko kuhli]
MGATDGFAEEQVMEEEECCDFEPLPTLLEDEENVSLADVLSLQDGCLTEQDIWAICLECCQSVKNIAHSAIFQTLCITPDTLAFNTNGNVCFMEQISGCRNDIPVATEGETGGFWKKQQPSMELAADHASPANSLGEEDHDHRVGTASNSNQSRN